MVVYNSILRLQFPTELKTMPDATKHLAYHFEGLIQVTEAKGYRQAYLQFPFEVPQGTGAVRLRLRYSPPKVGGVSNLITLGVFDPRGFRGNAHRNPPHPEVLISAEAATPGFLPGAVPPGEWLAQLALQAVLASDPPCAYTLDIELLPETGRAQPARPPLSFQAVRSKNAGWYRGELHSHTLHSDGSLTPAELLAGARSRGLDFLAVTDHNTISALSAIEQAADDRLLILPGIELTTFYGHALALGVTQWIDWRTEYNGWTMDDAARATHAAGGLFIIAHPQDIGSPVCTGCRWEYPDFDLDLADGVEIWNGGWRGSNDKNPKNLRLWRDLQSEARRIPATAGSDFHGGMDWWKTAPVTYIYAQNLSTPALLEGIRLGRMVLSSGPWLQIQVSTGSQSQTVEIGATLVSPVNRVFITAAWENAPQGAELVLSNRQGPLFNKPVSAAGTMQEWVEILPDDHLWVALYAADGDLLAITNPIYIEPPA